jgi:Prokaryotic phospholipase A2
MCSPHPQARQDKKKRKECCGDAFRTDEGAVVSVRLYQRFAVLAIVIGLLTSGGSALTPAFAESRYETHTVKLPGTGDHCTLSPDVTGHGATTGSFRSACDSHDECCAQIFERYGKTATGNAAREHCDNLFRAALYRVCDGQGTQTNACRRAAELYYFAVRTFGDRFWGS